jgi:hypothetical protein
MDAAFIELSTSTINLYCMSLSLERQSDTSLKAPPSIYDVGTTISENRRQKVASGTFEWAMQALRR